MDEAFSNVFIAFFLHGVEFTSVSYRIMVSDITKRENWLLLAWGSKN